MKQVVIMPGGFHPFHAGHYALYKQAQQAFPGADVYVAATNDTSTRPFPFALKEKLAKLAGVNPGKFIQVKSPFRAMEIVGNMDPATTQLIFVRSQKDADKPPQAGGVKKDGQPAYLQLLKGQTELAPMSQHAYMAYLPTVEFGPGMTSATEIRNSWPTLNERRKTALVMSLYPKTQKNPKLAATVVKMLDMAILGEELNEFAPAGGGGNIPRGPKTPRRGPWDDSGEDPYQLRRYNRSADFFDQFDSDGVDKQKFDKATGEYEGYYLDRDAASGITQIAYFKFDDPAKIGDNDPGVGWYYEPIDESLAEDYVDEKK